MQDENTEVKDFSSCPYPEIKRITAKHKRFGFENFGTIAHAYMESAINGTDTSLGTEPFSNKDIVALEGDSEALDTIKAVCGEMRDKFKQSELGKKAIGSEWHKAEYEFRSRIGEKIVKGTIDLVFKDSDGNVIVVDYKTNQEIKPDLYYIQLSCYRQAVSQMLGVKEREIRCFLYYLRFGEAVEITDECDKIDLEQAVKDVENS